MCKALRCGFGAAAVVCLLACFAIARAGAESRAWTDSFGRTLEATFHREQDRDKVLLLWDGDFPVFALRKELSAENQEWIRQHLEKIAAKEAEVEVSEPRQTANDIREEKLRRETIRTCTDFQGKKIHARLINHVDGAVVLESQSGQQTQVRPNQLSEADIERLKDICNTLPV